MKKVLVCSHGTLASGIAHAVHILMGEDAPIEAIDFYVDEQDKTPEVQAFIDGISPDDEGVICTDLKGGSVCNTVMQLNPESHGIFHVTGVNLICVLGILLADEKITSNSLKQIISDAQTQMELVEMVQEAASTSDDDFFV